MSNSLLKEKKERIWYWDTVKFLMILSVVLGHYVEEISDWRMDILPLKMFIYSYHMPIFIFIFGVFHSQKNFVRKALFYLVAGYLFKAFSYCSSMVIRGRATFTMFYDSGATWFLFVLLWYTVLSKLLEKADKRLVLIISFAISLFTGYFKAIGDCLCISRMLVFFPYFWLGTMINRDSLLQTVRKLRKYLRIPAACLLIGWLVLCFLKHDELNVLMHLLSGRNPFFKSTDGMGCLYRLLTTAVTVIVGMAIFIVVPEKKIPIISYMGRNTINVYFWHYTLIYITFRFLDVGDIVRTNAGIALILLIAVAQTLLLSLDIFNFPLKPLNRFIMSFKKKDVVALSADRVTK